MRKAAVVILGMALALRAALAAPAVETETISIKFATVQTVLQVCKTLLPSLSYQIDVPHNTLTASGGRRDLDELKSFLASVDIPLPRVMLDVRLVALTERGANTLGITRKEPVMWYSARYSAPNEPLESVKEGAPFPCLKTAPFARNPLPLRATLTMLASQNDARLVATPPITTPSGKTAEVFLRDRLPVTGFISGDDGFRVQPVYVGVRMKIAPTACGDGSVYLELTTGVSKLDSLLKHQCQLSKVALKPSTLRARLDPGDSLVISGLMREHSMSQENLPFLGGLPALGEHFRTSAEERVKSEFCVVVTPKIMPPP